MSLAQSVTVIESQQVDFINEVVYLWIICSKVITNNCEIIYWISYKNTRHFSTQTARRPAISFNCVTRNWQLATVAHPEILK